ncbi:hypothetical protein AB6A40_009467 [Gnathostoma spinigerum]|uniref:DUF19 domain-containing protein n=1 Tax=Gnathostoma spinigerum TaxID=75299 RepID=A0ABD6ESG9_9BILA
MASFTFYFRRPSSLIRFSIYAISYVHYVTSCPQSANKGIHQCVRPVAQYATVLNNEDLSAKSLMPIPKFGGPTMIPETGKQIFRNLCKLIDEFNECVAAFRKECSRHVSVLLIDASYGYLCNEGYSTFINHADCLLQLDQKSSVKKCHSETLMGIEKANRDQNLSVSAKLTRVCRTLNYFSNCVRIPILHECGYEAWLVIRQVLRDTTITLMPACHVLVNDPTSPQSLSLNENEIDAISADFSVSHPQPVIPCKLMYSVGLSVFV